MNCAHLYFTCYTTEAVKKESFVTWTLAIKPAEENNQSLKLNSRKEIFGHFICVFRFYYYHDNFGIIKIQNVDPQFEIVSTATSRNQTQCKQFQTFDTIECAILLLKVQVGQKMIHQRPHVFFISKRQERNYSHHSLKHTAMCPLQ